ncbi:MAG: YdcF family protein [Roseburia faecis]
MFTAWNPEHDLCGNGSCDRFRTAFFLIWIGIGIVVFLFGISVYMEVWKKVPHPVKIFAGMVVCIGLLVFCIVEGCVISQMHADGRGGLDYIIVLGAQVRKDDPSPVLKYRLDKAVEYLNENPDTVCIVSGGQGSNEPWSEAEGMARYLQEKGIDTARILTEDQSQTTGQNITNSKKLMKEGASVGIVTNNFHVFRALQIAKSTDFPMSVELRRIPHQNICRTICCGNFLQR